MSAATSPEYASGYASAEPTSPLPRKSHRAAKAVLAIVVLLIAAVVAYGVVLYSSIERLTAIGSTIDAQAAALETTLASQSLAADDVATALATVDDIQLNIADLSAELARWEWEVARYIPVYGEDVDTARSLLAIVERLGTNAIDPVAAVVDQILELPEGFEALAQVPTLLDEAADVLSSATDEVARASVALDLLPAFHIAELNDVAGDFKGLVVQLNEVLAELEPYLGAYSSLKDLLTGLGI